MKKILCLILAIIMGMTLAACGSDNSDEVENLKDEIEKLKEEIAELKNEKSEVKKETSKEPADEETVEADWGDGDFDDEDSFNF